MVAQIKSNVKVVKYLWDKVTLKVKKQFYKYVENANIDSIPSNTKVKVRIKGNKRLVAEI